MVGGGRRETGEKEEREGEKCEKSQLRSNRGLKGVGGESTHVNTSTVADANARTRRMRSIRGWSSMSSTSHVLQLRHDSPAVILK